MSALDELIARLQAVPPDQLAKMSKEVDARLAKRGVLWVPNPGPQTEAYYSPADILLFGGEPGGGKTGLLIGLALTSHQRSLIMRRQYTDLGRIESDLLQTAGRDGFRGQPYPQLQRDGRVVSLRAAKLPGDEQHLMGDRQDFIGLDEGTQFAYTQIRFLLGWLGSIDPKQRCRMVIASNPPLTAEGLWVIQMFAPWLDDRHPHPAKPGELRWFITDAEGNDTEVDGPQTVLVNGKPVKPMSRTFIPAGVDDNPFLARTDYRQKLDGMIEPYRSILMGRFKTVMKDQDNQVIPTEWIRAAQARWKPEPPKHTPMCAIGVDCSGGGDDSLILAPRYDAWFAPLVEIAGRDIPMDRIGQFTAGQIVSLRRDNALIVLDLGGGYGGSAYEHLRHNELELLGFRGATGCERRSRDGRFRFPNVRSAAYWLFREALDPGQPHGSPIALPDDPVLVADLTAPTFEVTPRGIQVEPKDKLVKRLGRSPDRGDAVVMAWWSGPRETTHALEFAQRRERLRKRGLGRVLLGPSAKAAQQRMGVRR